MKVLLLVSCCIAISVAAPNFSGHRGKNSRVQHGSDQYGEESPKIFFDLFGNDRSVNSDRNKKVHNHEQEEDADSYYLPRLFGEDNSANNQEKTSKESESGATQKASKKQKNKSKGKKNHDHNEHPEVEDEHPKAYGMLAKEGKAYTKGESKNHEQEEDDDSFHLDKLFGEDNLTKGDESQKPGENKNVSKSQKKKSKGKKKQDQAMSTPSEEKNDLSKTSNKNENTNDEDTTNFFNLFN